MISKILFEVQRGKLYLDFVRALIELEPKVFVMENVQGLVSANDGRAYRRGWAVNPIGNFQWMPIGMC